MFPFQKYKLYRSPDAEEGRFVKNNLCIVVSSDYSDDLESFLSKVLDSIKVDLKDCLILSDEPEVSDLKWVLNFNGEYESIKYSFFDKNGARVLFADSLKSIIESKDLKILLWEALKSEFIV